MCERFAISARPLANLSPACFTQILARAKKRSYRSGKNVRLFEGVIFYIGELTNPGDLILYCVMLRFNLKNMIETPMALNCSINCNRLMPATFQSTGIEADLLNVANHGRQLKAVFSRIILL